MEEKVKKLKIALLEITDKFDRVSFSSSLSADDMVLSHAIAELDLPINVFTLDTGRLHEETYQLIQDVQSRYDNQLSIYYPEASDLESFVNSRGPNAFYQSIDFRKICCQIRKVNSLKRALKNQQVWLTGLRRQQSVTRNELELMSWDDTFELYKFNPLIDWSFDDVWQFIKENEVPYNTLHDKGYPSIGCSPCTRAVSKGENERAGRWWWESPETKECGLHVATSDDNKVVA